MNWVDLTWPMLASTSLVLALVHGLVWLGQRRAHLHMAFAVAALAVAALTLLELAALHTASPERMAVLFRWMHVPVAVMVTALVFVVHRSFPGYGSTTLALAAVGLRWLSVVLDFTTGVNLNFRSIEGVAITHWWGVPIHYPVGALNPWLAVSQASNLLLLAYLAQNLFRGMKGAEDKRHAVLVVCGGWFLLVVLMMASALLMAMGMPKVPLTATPSFIVLMIVVSWQLGGDLFRSRQLSTMLHDSELRRLRIQGDLDMAAATSGLGLWYWDVARDEFVENGNNRELLGTDGADGRVEGALFAHVDTDESDFVRKAFHKAIREPNYELDYRIAGPDGERRWISLHGSVEFDDRGGPLMVRGVTQDVTRRRSEEEQLRSLLEAAPSALLLVDAKGRIRFANEQAARMFEYDSMAGVHIDALLPDRLRTRHAEHRQSFAAHPSARTMGQAMELFGVTREGREFPLEVGLGPMHLDNQLHVVAAVVDLTERKRMEQEVAMEREGLAHLSRVTMLGELSGSLAHELNQPLAAILSNAQAAQRMLRRDPSDIGEVQEILADIVDNDRRAGQVISRMRGLLKKEHREHRPLSLNEVVQDSLRLMRNDLLNRGVGCRFDLNPAVPRVFGDRVQLQQVILNLIVNACDAMAEQGERVVTVRTFHSDTGVCTEVVDTGHGIAEHMLENIFTPFETTKPSGMGMGLAVCRTIVRAHGGRIWAENAQSGGARVCFDLPGLE
ncbi:two-component system sensor histidine kinase NtrB [Lysobacter panacisoli]|uniref:histidine kinase n=1 Tax=Lysobacter panacisoli TaxID=1255263 RepID=A0ABP9LDP8_9GAMM|nr:ATP-binding protein [Lysobacter panacisoli]